MVLRTSIQNSTTCTNIFDCWMLAIHFLCYLSILLIYGFTNSFSTGGCCSSCFPIALQVGRIRNNSHDSASMCTARFSMQPLPPFCHKTLFTKKINRTSIRSGFIIKKKKCKYCFLAWLPLSREFNWTSLRKAVNIIFFRSKWSSMVWLPATKAGTLKIKSDIPGFYSHYQFLSRSYTAALFCHWPLWCCKKKEPVWHNKSWCHFCCNCIIPDWIFFSLIKVKYRVTFSLVGSNQL